jgi:hypothetical protein
MPGGSAGMGPAEAFAALELLMGEDRMHVVFGTGQVGHALAAVQQRDPGLVILPAHDPVAASRLAQATGQAPTLATA